MHGEPVDDESRFIILCLIRGGLGRSDFFDYSSLNRKSLKEDPDCPICYETLTEDQAVIITFCKVCGNNVHKVPIDNIREGL